MEHYKINFLVQRSVYDHLRWRSRNKPFLGL
jgi:hypothetical protein